MRRSTAWRCCLCGRLSTETTQYSASQRTWIDLEASREHDERAHGGPGDAATEAGSEHTGAEDLCGVSQALRTWASAHHDAFKVASSVLCDRLRLCVAYPRCEAE